MLTLFHSPKHGVAARGARRTPRNNADGSGARDPAKPHPHSKVPCLQHDGQRLCEIAAITLYLTDLPPQRLRFSR
jgi:glutathione S-transferase